MMSSLSRIVTSRSAGWGSVPRLIFFQSKITGMSVVSISWSGIRLSSSSSFHCSSVAQRRFSSYKSLSSVTVFLALMIRPFLLSGCWFGVILRVDYYQE